VQKGKPAKKYSQAGRVHDIIRLIESRHGISIEELVKETGVGRRTIHRDLNAIHEAGYPLVSEWLGNCKCYRFITRFKDVPPINFTLPELMTLSFLRSQLDMLMGTPFQQEMETILMKVNSVLPPRYAAHMERIVQVAHPLFQGRRNYGNATEQLQELRKALLYQQRITLDYQAQGKGRSAAYLVDPYTLIFYKGGLYLLGYAHNRQALRTFAVEWIRRVEVGTERFEIPADFSAERQLNSSFGIVREEAMTVTVRFSPEIAHAVQGRIWHKSQQVERTADGSVLLTFTAGGRMEIIAWLLSYGRHAEVLAPAELRREVAEILRTAAQAYRQEGEPATVTAG
jgi:proteasome accessory factor B